GIAGLACAFALARVGHRVLMLEKGDGIDNVGDGGIQIPPNLAKVLFNWGLKDRLQQGGLISHRTFIKRYDTGEHLGTQVWDEDVLRQSCGDFFLFTHRKLHQILSESAMALGVKVRHNASVTGIDGQNCQVELRTGEVLSADVIIGADGATGLSRMTVIDHQDPGVPTGIAVYATTVPSENVPPDFLNTNDSNTIKALGDRQCIIAYPIVSTVHTLLYYVYDNSATNDYSADPPLRNLKQLAIGCEPRLQQMVEHAASGVYLSVNRYTNSASWIDNQGHLLLIGQAAHPFPLGSIQTSAMAVEDAAVLGRLFRYLRRRDQISHFLLAFQQIRQPRIHFMFTDEINEALSTTMEDGESQRARDDEIRVKYSSGDSVLDKLTENPELDRLRVAFGYDCEDEADNWWVLWGMLLEHARWCNQRTAEADGISTDLQS
ncbi:FAD/NAD-P-binding domain-containing protein, partial [Sparassis latifolia]